MKKHEYKLTIKEPHLDFMGHVNNATYLTILEEARWELLLDYNYTLNDILKSGIGPVILECNIKFIKEIKLREKITIETQISALENKIGYIEQVILNENKEICTKAKFTFGFFDMKQRKLVEPEQKFKDIVNSN